MPVEEGAVDEDYRLAFGEIVLPVLRQFGPELVLVSAGFDAHYRDPLGGMRLTTTAYAAMTMALREVAEECCSGRIVVVTEGGYDLPTLADCLRTVTSALSIDPGSPGWPAADGITPRRGRDAVATVKNALATYWTF